MIASLLNSSRMRKLGFEIPLFFGVVILLSGVSSAQDSSKSGDLQRTENLIQLYKSVKSKPGAAACPVFKELSLHFNLDLMTKVPLEPHKNKLPAAQYTKLHKQFQELVDLVTVRDTGDAFDQLEYKLTGPHDRKEGVQQLRGKEIRIEGILVEEDLDVEIGFVWKQGKIVDVLVEGDSMILAYKNQFARIVKDQGIAALRQKMSERLQKEQSEGIRC
jgi:ABC-type transporter MlaC component